MSVRSYAALRASARLATAGLRALPSFLIVGAQKAGTSSLYSYLTEHPQIIGAEKKEVGYFGVNYREGEAWYRQHFPTQITLDLRDAITGEATPYYLYHPLAARRIVDLVPDVKIIVLLRDPVRRTLSHYWHARHHGFEFFDLREAIDMEAIRLNGEETRLEDHWKAQSYNHRHRAYVDRSRYAKQLKRYLDRFDSDQMRVVRSEHLFADVQGTVDRVTDFLGLDRFSIPETSPRNSRSYPEPDADIVTKLREHFAPHNQKLYSLLGRDLGW